MAVIPERERIDTPLEPIIQTPDENREKDPSLEGYLEPQAVTSQPVVDSGQTVLSTSQSQTVGITIPDEETLQVRRRQPIEFAVRWLAVFWERIKKKAAFGRE